jgi:hypothetical protein
MLSSVIHIRRLVRYVNLCKTIFLILPLKTIIKQEKFNDLHQLT